ncbi:hypothetical protein FRC17_004257 [Serendipita sp. 399]|nr:hypothetical protein FRC17_004257 [Serendipita sp. 399]
MSTSWLPAPHDVRKGVAKQIAEYSELRTHLNEIKRASQESVRALENSMNDELRTIDKELKAMELKRKRAEDNHQSLIEAQRNRNLAIEEPLQERLNQLGRSIALNRYLLVPVARIPVDVLSLIFQEYVSMECSAWILVLVCEHWKATALSTASLWGQICISVLPGNSYMHIHHTIGGDVGVARSYLAYQVCSTIDELKAALMRSKMADLHIRVSLHNSTEVAQQLLMRVFDPATSPRIRGAQFGFNSFSMAMEPQRIFTGHYPLLESVHVTESDTSWSNSFIAHLLSSAAGIRRLYTHGYSRLAHFVGINWKSLRELHLLYGANSRDLDAICTQLENVTIFDGIPHSWPSGSTPLMTFNRILKLRLACDPRHLHRLQLPALNTLEVVMSSDHSIDTEFLPWNLPSLVKLTVTIESTRFNQWLPSLSLPLLQDLHLINYRESSGEFPNVVYPTVRSLSINESHNTDDYSIRALEAVPNVHSVLLSAPYREREFGKELLARLAANGPAQLCPELSEFTLGTPVYRVGGQKKVLVPLIKRVIATRRRSLKSFVVNWTRRRGETTDVRYI